MSSHGERGMGCFGAAKRQPLGERSDMRSARQRPNIVRPLGRGRSTTTMHEKENTDVQARAEKSQDDQKRRLMMELTDLRAESRELREMNKKQKANLAIDGRMYEQQMRRMEEELKKEKEARETSDARNSEKEEENRFLKQKLMRTQAQALAAQVAIHSNASSVERMRTGHAQAPPPPSHAPPPPAPSGAHRLAAQPPPHSKAPPPPPTQAPPPHTPAPPPPTTPIVSIFCGTPVISSVEHPAALPTAGDGDASGGGDRRTIALEPQETPSGVIAKCSKSSDWAIAVGAAAEAGAAAALAQAAAQASVEKIKTKCHTEVPKLSLSPSPSEASAGTKAELSANLSSALEQLKEGTSNVTPGSRERLVKLFEEQISSLRRESEIELRRTEEAQTLAAASRVPSVRSSRRAMSGGMVQPSPRTSSNHRASKDELVRAINSLTSARENARLSTRSNGGTLSARSAALSPRFPGGSKLSPRLDESCNSACDSVVSLMTGEDVNKRIDKMTANIHTMLMAGRDIVEAPKCSVSPVEEGEWPLSPTSGGSEHTCTSNEILDTSPGPSQLALIEEALPLLEQEVCFQVLRQQQLSQEAIPDAQDLKYRLHERDKENECLRNKLREAEIVHMNWHMEMQALRHALRNAQSVDACSSSVGAAGTVMSAEDSDRSKPPSPYDELSVGTGGVKPPSHSSASSYCWPPPPPGSHMAWQRRSSRDQCHQRSQASGLHRPMSLSRITHYPRPPMHSASAVTLKMEETVMVQKRCTVRAMPSRSGSSQWLMEGPSAPTSRPTSPTLRRSSSVPGATLAAAPSVPALETAAFGSHLPWTARPRSSSPVPVCTSVPTVSSREQTAATARSTKSWSSRSTAWKKGSSAPGSRSPSPVASLAAPPGMSSRASSMTALPGHASLSRVASAAALTGVALAAPPSASRSPSPVASLVAPPGKSSLTAIPGVSLTRAASTSALPTSALAVPPAASRSPSPPSPRALKCTPVVGGRYTDILVKLRDSPPRIAPSRGSLIHRSHWRLVRNLEKDTFV